MILPVHRSPLTGRRRVQQLLVTVGVVAGHVLLMVALCWEVPRVSVPATPRGADGAFIMASLVDAVPADQDNDLLKPPTPATQAAVPVVAAEPVEQVEDTPLDEVAPSDMSDTLPSDVSSSSLIQAQSAALATALTTALAEFTLTQSAGTAGQTCDPNAVIVSSFAHSPAVHQALEALPPDQRSVANAVMLWDGDWPQDTRNGGKALLRALLIKALVSLPGDCLDTLQRGPILVLVPQAQRTAVLAIGSGEWRWADLMVPQTNVLPSDRPEYFRIAASEIRGAP